MGRPPKADPQQVIYDVTVKLMTAREAAEKHGITDSRVYQILRDAAQHELEPDIHVAMHAIGLQTIKRRCLEIMNDTAKAMFDVKGNPLVDPETGLVVRDNTEALKAGDLYNKADSEQRKLYARDMPRRQEIMISQQRSEVQIALDMVRTALQSDPEFAKRVAISSAYPDAIEGHSELKPRMAGREYPARQAGQDFHCLPPIPSSRFSR
jgi:hypothetical protein